MRAFLLAAILCFTVSLSGATTRPNLTGTVVDSDGSPLAGVTVMVYHAGVKVGYSTFCPSCYVDWASARSPMPKPLGRYRGPVSARGATARECDWDVIE